MQGVYPPKFQTVEITHVVLGFMNSMSDLWESCLAEVNVTPNEIRMVVHVLEKI